MENLQLHISLITISNIQLWTKDYRCTTIISVVSKYKTTSLEVILKNKQLKLNESTY